MAWKEFFQQFGRVNAVTIAKKNGELINLLCERKGLLTYLRQQGTWYPRTLWYRSTNINTDVALGAPNLVLSGWDNPEDENYLKPELRRALSLCTEGEEDQDGSISTSSVAKKNPFHWVADALGFGNGVALSTRRLKVTKHKHILK